MLKIKLGASFTIGDATVFVNEIYRRSVKVAIRAPKDILIRRQK